MKLKSLKEYKILLFDCDGVLINSNRLKTNAFHQVTANYGEEAAQSLIKYHQKHGGVSRYKKFEYFLREIIGITVKEKIIQDLSNNFAEVVEKGLLNCDSVPNLQLLRGLCEHIKWIVVSGGNQEANGYFGGNVGAALQQAHNYSCSEKPSNISVH